MKNRFWLAPFVAASLAALACTGTPSAMQILDAPVFVCPTATPRPTDTPPPTSVQPPVIVPPSGWATRTAVPGCIWNGSFCAPSTAVPGGVYTTPASIRPGATSTPRPTSTPYPTPTPFVMRPPQDFFSGDAIYTGGFASPINLRLRLLSSATVPALPGPDGLARAIARWQLEISNVGTAAYEVFPAWQMYVSTVTTASGDLDGVWGASLDATLEAGILTPLDALTLAPGETRLFALAAYIPAGTARRFTFVLDPTERAAPHLPGRNPLVWTSSSNPHCVGDLTEPFVLPTPLG